MIFAVDTNILADLLLSGTPHRDESQQRLAEARRQGDLIVCEAVYAEIAPFHDTVGEVDAFLADSGIALQRSSPEALLRAGRAWRAYSRRRPRLPACSRCGTTREVRCENCGAELQYRQHTIADFLIGGHAVTHADRLLTRDSRTYQRYFPELALA